MAAKTKPTGGTYLEFPIPYKRQPPQAAQILAMRGAKEAARRLGYNLDYKSLLYRLAAMVVLKEWGKATFSGHWAEGRVDGGSQYEWTLQRFPGRVVSFAEEIAQVNAHPFFDTDTTEFITLPDILKRYSEHLRSRLNLFASEAPAADREGRNLWRTMLASLPDLIKGPVTGAQYGDLATLADAAMRAYGVADERETVTKASLRALHKRPRETVIETFILGTDSMTIGFWLAEYSGPFLPSS